MSIHIAGTAKLRRSDGQVLLVQTDELEYIGDTGSGRQMGPEMIHNYSYSDLNGNEFIWEVSEYPAGVLNFVIHQRGKFELINDFEFSILSEPETKEEFEFAVEQVISLFTSDYVSPYDNYKFRKDEYGLTSPLFGAYKTEEALSKRYSAIYPSNVLHASLKRIDPAGTKTWDKQDSDHVINKTGQFELEETDISKTKLGNTVRSKPLDSFPIQERGFNFGIENGKVVYRPSLIDIKSITARLHKSLLEATEMLKENQRTIGNKYKLLLVAIDAYFDSINKDVALVDAVDVYALGLDFDTEYKVALEFSGDDLGQYPELNKAEKSSIEKVLRRHAAYIQSTPEGAYFTDAEERHLRSFEEENAKIREIKNAASLILKRPDIGDQAAAQLIYDFADPSPNDPNASRKKALSRIGLRNFLIVAGIGTAIVSGGGAGIGIAVGSVAGPAIGGAVGTFSAAGLGWISKRVFQETKAFKEFTDTSAAQVDQWIEKERPKLKPLAEFFRDGWEVFRPTVDSPGIDKWFENVHYFTSRTHKIQSQIEMIADGHISEKVSNSISKVWELPNDFDYSDAWDHPDIVIIRKHYWSLISTPLTKERKKIAMQFVSLLPQIIQSMILN